LYESLDEISPASISNQFKKFPKLKRQLSRTISNEKLNSYLTIFDSYLKVVSRDERLAQSEAFYGFLCPSPDYYKNQIERNSIVIDDKFSISSIFKRYFTF